MKKAIMPVSLVLNVILAAALFLGVGYARTALLDMESLCAEAETARLRGYVSALERDREDGIESVTSLMKNAIRDNGEGRPSVKAPDWCWRR